MCYLEMILVCLVHERDLLTLSCVAPLSSTSVHNKYNNLECEILVGSLLHLDLRHPFFRELATSRMSSGHDILNYVAADENHGGSRMLKDTLTLGSAYDRYLQSSQVSLSPGEGGSSYSRGSLRAVGGGIPALQIPDPLATGRPGIGGPELATTGRRMTLSDQFQVDEMIRSRESLPLPLDASSTLYVEGLPPDSTKREVAHIFRPFVGYKEVRLVMKESKHRGDPIVLCFVDFMTPACAATALNALQGYKMDELDPHSAILRLQFSKFPGPRSGGVSRGKR